MQQQFLFDQRQSKNFICQDNPRIEKAKILFDQNEPIAIQNRYGILVFSNYSVTRLQQCIKALDSKKKGTLRGTSEFKELFHATVKDLKEKEQIIDTNHERVLPSFERLSQNNIESCFTELFKKFRSTHTNQSTAIIKTCLLLNCCGLPMESLQSTLKKCVDEKKLPDINKQDQDLLMLRIQNLIYTQHKELNKQYFNSSEIEQCWQLYFNLHISPLKQPKEHKHNSQSSSSTLELELVPKVEKKRTIKLPENLAESEFEQMLQYFEYTRRLKLQKKQEGERLNTLESSKKMSIPHQQSQMTSLFRKDYVIEYKFGQKFYLDQKKVAFFETKNTSEITVVSHQHEHIRDALFLARAKFGVVLVFGTDEFKKQVQQIADSEDIKIEFKTTAQQKVNAAIENSPIGNSAAKNDSAEPKPPRRELSLEPKDPSIINKEDRADNFYKNQSVTSRNSRKESTQENSYDYGPGF
ncbi:LPD7 domain-containing protein [Acinetobacter sp. YH12227]|nr:LPD7 domain-containing protein [Acinetobacter sp. YH12227]